MKLTPLLDAQQIVAAVLSGRAQFSGTTAPVSSLC